MRVLVTRRLPERVTAAVRARFDAEVRDETAPLSPEAAAAGLRDFDAVLATIGDPFDAAAFGAVPAPRCRLIANFGVGVNHIDLGAAKAAGVAVTNTPGVVTDATADLAMTLLLMVARRASEGERLVRGGSWQGWHPTQMLGTHVTGRTIGIVGMGRIGQAVARRAHHGFGMRVLAFNRSPVGDASLPFEQVPLPELLGQADFVVVAVPGGPATRHLIDGAALGAMQRAAFLVNISRGDVVDEAALVEALETGRIAGAGLDVYEREPVVPDRLRALETVVLLPHLGTAALEVREAMGMKALDNLAAFAEGRALPNPV